MNHLAKIGNKFSNNSPVLDLFPGRSLPSKNLYSVNVSYISVTEWHKDGLPLTETRSDHLMIETGDNLKIIVGEDVHSITYSVYGNRGGLNKNMSTFHVSVRVDRLILLNLANKFFKLTVPL